MYSKGYKTIDVQCLDWYTERVKKDKKHCHLCGGAFSYAVANVGQTGSTPVHGFVAYRSKF